LERVKWNIPAPGTGCRPKIPYSQLIVGDFLFSRRVFKKGMIAGFFSYLAYLNFYESISGNKFLKN
jgi:hypothetical protein